MSSSKSNLKSKTVAGLALHSDSLYYLEIERKSFSIVRQESIPLVAGAIVKDQLNNIEALGVAFESLKSKLGKFSCPVVMGIPARDVTLRLIDYPRISLEDLRGVLALEFEKHFPYAWNEAVADIAEVEVPVSNLESGNMTILAATSELSKVNNLLKVAARTSMQILALEPMNIAFFRAATGAIVQDGAYLVMDVEPEVTYIMLGYKDNGILFRSAPVDITNPDVRNSDEGLQPIIRDVQNTLVFAGNQYKGIEVKNMILGGRAGYNMRLRTLLENWVSLDVMTMDVCDLWQIVLPNGNASDYEAALGLALRNLI